MRTFCELIFLCFFPFIRGEESLFSKTLYSTFSKKNYMVVASQILRSRITFGIAVHVFDDPSSSVFFNRSFQFQAIITSNSNEIVWHTETLFWNYPQMVYFPIPTALSGAAYELRMIGTNLDEKTIFDESSKLIYDAKFLSVSFQTSRPIYRSGQTVRFRIIVLETTLLPFNDVMDVFILDPENFIMKRWLSTYTNNGVASLSFRIPRLAKNGVWKIQSKISGQIDEKSIIVHTYYQPLFEVIVDCAPYTSADEDVVSACVYGLFPSQKFVRGNATISWFARQYSNTSKFNFIHSHSIFINEKKAEISLSIKKLESFYDDISQVEVKIIANLTEFMSGETVSGFSHSRIIVVNASIQFLSKSPIVFTPGTVLSGYVVVSNKDYERIHPDKLKQAVVRIQITTNPPSTDGKHSSVIEVKGSDESNGNNVENFYDSLARKALQKRFLETSIIPYSFDIPEATLHVELRAALTLDGKHSEDRLNVVQKFLPEGKYVRVWTASDDLYVNDDVVFHVKMNFETDTFYSLVVAKGLVLQIEEHAITTSSFSSITISKTTSAEMAPLFHILVYCFSHENGVLSDVISVPVNGFERYETALEINSGKDFRNEMVEALASGAEGAFIGVQAVRSVVYRLQGGHEVTTADITDNIMTAFERNYRSLSKVTWISRTGDEAKVNYYLPSHNYAFDTHHAFHLNSLILMTNLDVPISHHYRECHNYNLYLPCLTEECFPSNAECNGLFDCLDGTDESNCPSKSENREEYFLYRISWNSFIFDEKEGDWAFFEFRKNDHEGIEFQFLNTPTTADDWYFSAINMDMKYGFSSIAAPVVFSSRRPLMAHVLGPARCHRGEQLGLKIYLHNFDINQMLVTVTLINSDHYKFVHVGAGGIVASYSAKLESGDHQKLIYMGPETQQEIHFPVAPSIEHGSVEIKFEVSSQAGRNSLSHLVEVMSEGALVNRHTSVSVDLNNRGLILQYLDIVVEETPIVPYEIWRRYVFGSPSANLTISNNIIGPIEKGRFLTTSAVLNRESKGAMDILFELYINIWSLHYLRYTNELTWNVLRDTLNHCNALYAEVMRYFRSEGGFEYWETSRLHRPSVWLTAWALRVFSDVNFPDWEFYMWIDSSIFLKIIKWILNHQNEQGLFFETPSYKKHNFNEKIRPYPTVADIILTAHVLISLHSSSNTIDGPLKSNATISCHKARGALEKLLPELKDPHAIAMIAYAFSITNGLEAGFAFDLLQKHVRMNDEGLHYWSRLPISVNPVKLENQRRYTKPRLYETSVSSAVESTSWALLVYIARDGNSPFVENIVQWLMSVRMTNNGFISVMDTAIAYRALAEFSLRSRILDITNMDLNVEMMASSVTKHHMHVSNKSASVYNLQVPHVWGHVDITAKGSGLAFIQMDVNYGIDDARLVDKPSENSFFLQIDEFYSSLRNKSTITIQTCLKYIPTSPLRSEAVILEIQIPSGYTLLESDAFELLGIDIHPGLRDVRFVQGKTVWFFDYVTRDLRCFNHSVKRWYPVANLTLYRNAIMYEIFARERFVQVLINSTPLYTLSICEVCGSYQCPYCPYYNAASPLQPINIVAYLVFYLFASNMIRIG